MREPTSHARSAWRPEILSYAPIPCQCEPPPHAAEYGGNPERKTPFPFSKRIPPPPNKNAWSVFLSGFCPPSIRAVRTAEMPCGSIQKKAVYKPGSSIRNPTLDIADGVSDLIRFTMSNVCASYTSTSFADCETTYTNLPS